MLIHRVLFRYGDVTEMITLESIEQHRKYITVKDHLYCATPNCHCKMMYIPEGKRIAHFKKWKGRNYQHLQQCPFYKETVMEGRPKRLVRATITSLNDRRIQDVLTKSLKKFRETEEQKQQRLAKNRARAKEKRNRIKDSGEELLPEFMYVNKVATSTNGEGFVEKEKSPPVKTRSSILDFNIGDIGETQSTTGYLESIVISDRTALLNISDKLQRLTFTIYLENEFFEQTHFSVRKMLNDLQRMRAYNENVEISCIGEIVNREGIFGMRVKSVNNLRFNGQYLDRFLYETDSIFNYAT